MNVIHVPVNITVLSELNMAIQRRVAELRQNASVAADPEYLKRLAERQGALAFLGEQVKRIRYQIAPIIDITAASPSEDAKSANNGAKQAPAM